MITSLLDDDNQLVLQPLTAGGENTENGYLNASYIDVSCQAYCSVYNYYNTSPFAVSQLYRLVLAIFSITRPAIAFFIGILQHQFAD